MKIRRIIVRGCLGFVFFCLVALLVDVRLLAALPFGWIAFLKRVLPQITVNWNVIGMAAVCMTAIFLGANYFCSWFYVSLQKARAVDLATHPWSWKWTGCLLVTICLPFFIGMAVIGAIHQIAWMLTSKEPLYMERQNYYSLMNQKELAFRISLNDLNQNGTNELVSYAALRKAVHKESFRNLDDKLQTLVVEDEHGIPSDLIIFARDPQIRIKREFLFETPEEGRRFKPPEQLPQLLDKYAGRMKAL